MELVKRFVDVVAGVIVHNGKILLSERRPGSPFEKTWECPGGKLLEQSEESDHDALRRELREEIGIDGCQIAEAPLFSGWIDSAEQYAYISFYVVTSFSGNPVPLEGQKLDWFSKEEMLSGRLKLSPGNRLASEKIAKAMDWLAQKERT